MAWFSYQSFSELESVNTFPFLEKMGNCLGFGKQGVEANTWASNYQSLHYGGLTPSGGWFAGCQSAGAKGGGGFCSIFIHFASILIGGLLLCLGVIIGLLLLLYYYCYYYYYSILTSSVPSVMETLQSLQLMLRTTISYPSPTT